MTEKKVLLKATYGSSDKPLRIGEIEIPCYVLEDGTRVISQRGINTAFTGKHGGGGAQKMPRFLASKGTNSLISEDLMARVLNPIEFNPGAGRSAFGYEATILPDICEVIIDANKTGLLKDHAQADIAEILLRGFAKVGIVALIDEATGYQYDREQDELQKLLKKYVSEELLPWQKTFPDVFYSELFRLNGWDFTVQGIKKRPGCIGTWTNKLVYEQLPPGVLDDLKKRTPKTTGGNRSHRYFQLLTEDIGNPHLASQINQVITLFQLSDNMKHMWGQFEKLNARKAGQLELPYTFDEKGHTIAPVETDRLSDFNKSLKKALDYKDE